MEPALDGGDVLFTLWIVAVVIAASALVIMMALIGIRLVANRVRARRELRRQSLLMSLLGWLEGAKSDEEMRGELRSNREVAISLLIEIFELVRGEDQLRLASLADEAKLPRYLRETIEIGKADERKSAAESLVWFPSHETRAVLLFALNDRDPDVSLAAAGSLAQLGERLPIRLFLESRLAQTVESSRQLEAVLARVALQQQDELLELARDASVPERLRAGAIDAIGRSGSFALIEPLAALAEAASPAIRAAVCRALAIFGHPGAEAAITRCLHDAAWEVRAEAAEAAGRIGLVGTIDRLAGLLDDANWWVRFRAGTALAVLGEAGTAMLKAAAGRSTEGAGRMAALILAERGIA